MRPYLELVVAMVLGAAVGGFYFAEVGFLILKSFVDPQIVESPLMDKWLLIITAVGAVVGALAGARMVHRKS